MPRYRSIDGARGIAALSVVFWHAAIVWPGLIDTDPVPGWAWVIRATPLHALWAGPQAVELFFVLSGFVLAVGFTTDATGTAAFLIRRALRLFPAYLVALGLSLALAGTHAISVAGTTPWFAAVGELPLDAGEIARQVSMLGSTNADAYDPVLWSLVVEARVSLVFPLLMWLVLRYPGWMTFSGALAAGIIDLELGLGGGAPPTTRWLVLFVAGILVATNRSAVTARWRSLHWPARAGLGAGALVGYTSHYLWASTNPSRATLDVLLTGAACVIALIAVVSEDRLQRILETEAIQALGRVSYSLYLLHAVVVVGTVRLLWALHAPLTLPVAEALGLALVLPAAWACHRFVERPGIRQGRLIAAWLSARRGPPVAPRSAPAPAPDPG